MELKFYHGKKVNIVATNGKSFIGIVNDYFFPDDNEFNEESIVIDTIDGDVIEFTKNKIQTITIM